MSGSEVGYYIEKSGKRCDDTRWGSESRFGAQGKTLLPSEVSFYGVARGVTNGSAGGAHAFI